MLKMENVSKTYRHRGQLVTALDGADAEIPGGDFVSIVGPSGSGRSTLLLMLGGMLSPSGGRVLLDDQSIYDLDSNARAHLRKQKVGFVFQTFNLVPYLSAIENVQVPLYLVGRDNSSQQVSASSNEWPWPGCSPITPPWSSPMSRLATWTRRRASK